MHFNINLDYLLMRFTIVILSTFVLSALGGKRALHKDAKHGQKSLRALKEQGHNSNDDRSSLWFDYIPATVSVASPAKRSSSPTNGSPVTVVDRPVSA